MIRPLVPLRVVMFHHLGQLFLYCLLLPQSSLVRSLRACVSLHYAGEKHEENGTSRWRWDGSKEIDKLWAGRSNSARGRIREIPEAYLLPNLHPSNVLCNDEFDHGVRSWHPSTQVKLFFSAFQVGIFNPSSVNFLKGSRTFSVRTAHPVRPPSDISLHITPKSLSFNLGSISQERWVSQNIVTLPTVSSPVVSVRAANDVAHAWGVKEPLM